MPVWLRKTRALAGRRLLLIASAGAVVGCAGGGDESTRPVPATANAADAGIADAGAADHRSGGRVADAGSDASSDAMPGGADATIQGEVGDSGTGPRPAAAFSSAALDVGPASCDGTPATGTITVSNVGGSPLVVATSVVGTVFSVSPTSLALPPAASGKLTVTATVPSGATAGVALVGALAIFSNDPGGSNRVLPLSATPTGATLSGPTLYAFASSQVSVAAPPITFELKNAGTAPAVVTLGSLSDSSVTIDGLPNQGITLGVGETFATTASFTPRNTTLVRSTVAITTNGATCGSSLTSVTFQGQGATSQVQGWPTAPVDFGPVPCRRRTGAPGPSR